MAKSSHVRQHELRAIYLLVGECRELGADLNLWRRHLMQGLDRLIGDHVTIYCAGAWPGEARSVVPDTLFDRGWESAAAHRHYRRYLRDLGPDGDPCWPPFCDQFERPLHTAMRRQLVDDPAYYKSAYYNEYKKHSGLDDCILSFGVTGVARFDILALHRRLNERPWTEREVTIVNLLHDAILPRIGGELASADDHARAPLSPRLEQTLMALLEGLDERQVARRLELSQYTVHQYVKMLYERYRVHSRSELLALWIRRHRR